MRKNNVLAYLHGDHLGSTVLSTSSANATLGHRACGPGAHRALFYTGSTLTRYQFTGQYIDDTGLYYMNARYYDREIGQFLSPDTLVPDPSNLFDYNRYMYTRGNPMKYTDPTGHCATLEGGAPDTQGDAECWGLAYSIYGYGLTEQQFTEDWKVSPDAWLENIAKAQYADVNYLKPFFEKYHAVSEARTGQNHGVPNPVDNSSSSQIGISINPDGHGFLMMGLKAGTVAGPIMMESGALMCGTVILCTSGIAVEVGGMVYTVVGYTTVAVDDVILPLINLDFRALAGNVINEGIDTGVEHVLERGGFEQVAPWVGPVHDTIDALNVDICVGNKC